MYHAKDLKDIFTLANELRFRTKMDLFLYYFIGIMVISSKP